MLVDVTVVLQDTIPHWPGEPGFERRVDKSVELGDAATVSTLRFGTHTGTHMDAPLHFVPGGAGMDAVDLDACIGPCYVADLTAVSGAIGAADLEQAGIPDGCERLLAKTRNSGWSRDTAFTEDFCAYDGSAAEWCLRRGLRLVGIDYLSIEPFGSGDAGHPTHHTLLGAGVVVLEGVELATVQPGEWEIIALPMHILGGDGAPARVVLRR